MDGRHRGRGGSRNEAPTATKTPPGNSEVLRETDGTGAIGSRARPPVYLGGAQPGSRYKTKESEMDYKEVTPAEAMEVVKGSQEVEIIMLLPTDDGQPEWWWHYHDPEFRSPAWLMEEGDWVDEAGGEFTADGRGDPVSSQDVIDSIAGALEIWAWAKPNETLDDGRRTEGRIRAEIKALQDKQAELAPMDCGRGIYGTRIEALAWVLGDTDEKPSEH